MLEKQVREKKDFIDECEQQKKEEAEEMCKLRVEMQHILEQGKTSNCFEYHTFIYIILSNMYVT